MQLSRAFFLTPEKTVKRKMTEMLIAVELEQKFYKQQIFAIYSNWVDLGQRGSFAIRLCRGLASLFQQGPEGHHLPEAALLAGLIQAPAISHPIAIPSALSNGATWFLKPWSKPAP